MRLVKIGDVDKSWNIKTLYHGLWARAILSRTRFKALMAMLHVVDPANEDKSRFYYGKRRNFEVRSILLFSAYAFISIWIALSTEKSHDFLVLPQRSYNITFPTKERFATTKHFHCGLVGFQGRRKVSSVCTCFSAKVKFVGEQIFGQSN